MDKKQQLKAASNNFHHLITSGLNNVLHSLTDERVIAVPDMRIVPPTCTIALSTMGQSWRCGNDVCSTTRDLSTLLGGRVIERAMDGSEDDMGLEAGPDFVVECNAAHVLALFDALYNSGYLLKGKEPMDLGVIQTYLEPRRKNIGRFMQECDIAYPDPKIPDNQAFLSALSKLIEKNENEHFSKMGEVTETIGKALTRYCEPERSPESLVQSQATLEKKINERRP